MAVPTGEQHSINFLLKADSTLIGGQIGATLTESVNMVGQHTKDDNRWARNINGMQSWEISANAMRLESSNQITGQDGMTLSVSSDGGSNYDEVKALETATLNLSMATAEIVNNTTAGHTARLPDIRDWSIEANGDYLDPQSTDGTGMDTVLTAKENGNNLEAKLEFGSGAIYEGTIYVSEREKDVSGEAATNSITLMGDGSLTRTSGAGSDSGLDVLLDAFFADPPTSFTALIERTQDGSSTSSLSGATQEQGTAYLTDATLEVPFGEEITIDVTLTGDGQLTRSTQ